MQYRRAYQPDGCYFFTLNLADRKQTLLTEHIDQLRHSFRQVKQRHPFEIEAMVVLPDHLHCIWSLPEGDFNFVARWQLIKASFSRSLPCTELISDSRKRKGERGIWQRRYWEHLIRDEKDFNNHVNYIHYNPVKHGYVTRVADWPYSSFHLYLRRGKLSQDWGSEFQEPCEMSFGERK